MPSREVTSFGWKIFPVAGKVPHRGTRGLKDASADLRQVEQWEVAYPESNSAIATGASNLVVIDVDPRHDGHVALARFEDDNGRLPHTIECMTGGSLAGRHIYFRAPEGIPIRSRNNALGAGVDVKAEGGYVVAPGSKHPETERIYEWAAGCSPNQVELADLPNWLVELLRDRPRPVVAQTAMGHLPDDQKLKRARAYLAQIPSAVSGQGGHDQTFAAAQAMAVGFDLPEEQAYRLLLDDYNPRCAPPWEEHQLRHKVQDAAGKSRLERGYLLTAEVVPIRRSEKAGGHLRESQPERTRAESGGPPPASADSELLTETGMAEAVVHRYGNRFRYVGAWKKWLVWDGRRWVVDKTGSVQRDVKRTIREMRATAARDGNETQTSILFKAERRTVRDNIEALARHELKVQLDNSALDVNPFLLNVQNGTVDLRTGQLGPHRREDFLSKLAPTVYEETAVAPTWLSFLDRIFAGKSDLIGFVQRAIGYSLTADVSEQCLFICFGGGANGKSTLLEALRAALGDYARAAPMDLFVASKGDRHPTELATLVGVRFAPCVETRDGARLNETLLKQLTGGDTVQARRMREDFWEFPPVAKLWLGTNHRPTIRGTDLAIWRRIRLIPFTVTIPPAERDGALPQKLRRESPGILRWAVTGCLDWQRRGLDPPGDVMVAVEEYRTAEDRLAFFISERCSIGPGRQVSHGTLYAAFKDWATSSGEYVLSGKAFSEQLKERGFEGLRAGHGGAKTWRGIGLLDDRVFDGDRSSVSPHGARAPEVNRITEHHRTPLDTPSNPPSEDAPEPGWDG